MRKWQHDETGRTCEAETKPGNRWYEITTPDDSERDAWDGYEWLVGETPNAKWAAARWDALWSTGARGHYETLSRLVFEAYEKGMEIGRQIGVESVPAKHHESLVFKNGESVHVMFDSRQDRDRFHFLNLAMQVSPPKGETP